MGLAQLACLPMEGNKCQLRGQPATPRGAEESGEPCQEPWAASAEGPGRGDAAQPRASVVPGEEQLARLREPPMGVGTWRGTRRLHIPPGMCWEAAPAEPAAAG